MFEEMDVTLQAELASTDPQTAAENLKEASVTGSDPDTYAEIKAADPVAMRNAIRPPIATRRVAQAMSTSSQKASLLKDDMNSLSDFERRAHYFKDTIQSNELQRQVNHLQNKKYSSDGLTPTEEFNLLSKAQQLRKLSEKIEGYGYGFTTGELPGASLGAIYDMARGAFDQSKILGGAAAAGATVRGGLAIPTGPVGVAVSAASGALQGAAAIYPVASFKDTYEQTKGAMLYEFDFGTDDKGRSYSLPQQEKVRLASGTAALVSLVDTFGLLKVLKKVPLFRRIRDPKSIAREISKPQNRRWVKFAKDYLSVMVTEGGTEGVQELFQVVGAQAGSNWDGSEIKVLNAFQGAIKKTETWKRVGTGAAVGAVVGGSLKGVADVAEAGVRKATKKKPAPEKPKEVRINKEGQYEFVDPELETQTIRKENRTDMIGNRWDQPPELKGTRAIQLQIAISEWSALTAESKVRKFAPATLEALRRQILEDAGMSHVYVDRDGIESWSNTPEKLEKLRSILGEDGFAAMEADAPISIDIAKFMSLVDEDPKVIGLAKIEPEDMSADQYNEYLLHRQGKREGYLLTQGTLDDFAAVVKFDESGEVRVTDPEVKSEEQFLQQATVTDILREAMPEAEVAKFDEDLKHAKLDIVESIDDAAEREMNELIDVHEEILRQNIREELSAKMDSDPKIKLVDAFLGDAIVQPLSPEQESRRKQGKRVWAIDYNTLGEDLRLRFKNIGTLKDRGVFAKGGVSLLTALHAFGVKDGNTLLEILATTPSREQAIKAHMEANRLAYREEAEFGTDLNDTAVSKSYENMIGLNRKVMEAMRDKAWGSTSKMIKRIAFDVEPSSTFTDRARVMIRNMPMKSIKPNQWKMGYVRSTRRALSSFVKKDAEIEQSFVHKEEATFALAATKEAHIALGQANKTTRMLTKLLSRKNRNVVREAGPAFEKPFNEILELFNMDRASQEKSTNEFMKFQMKMQQEGNGNYPLPEGLPGWFTGALSVKDLTVDQYKYLVDQLAWISKAAADHNTLLEARQEAMVEETLDTIAETARVNIEAHPDYNPARPSELGDTGAGALSPQERAERIMSAGRDLISNIQSITTQLDRGVQGGFWSQLIYQPLVGIGKHAGIFGQTAATALKSNIADAHMNLIRAYGNREYKRLGRTVVRVREFGASPGLKNGNLTKLDLVMLLMNMGNDGNIKAVENFGVERDVVWKVLKRELQEKDFVYVQGVWDIFKSLEGKIRNHEKMTRGVDIEMVQPSNFTAFGKEFRGGYFPIKYANDYNFDAIRKRQLERFGAAMESGSEKVFITPPGDVYQGIVRSPHTNERVGSKHQLNLSASTIAIGLEDVSYDLTMRVPVRNVMNVLLQKDISEMIRNTVGDRKYMTLVNATMESTRSASVDDITLYDHQQRFVRGALMALEGGIAVTYIAFNPSSMLVQFDSMRHVVNKMGIANSSKYLTKAALKFLNPINLTKLSETYAFAAKLDPSIELYRQSIDDVGFGGVTEHLPKKRALTSAPYHLARDMQEGMTKLAFTKILGTVDVSMKAVTALAAYDQFISGDVATHPKDKLATMSKAEIFAAAQGYVAELSSSSLTAGTTIDRAAIQKQFPSRLFTRFWNDSRNALNSNIQAVRSIKYNIKKANDLTSQGEYLAANAEMQDAGERAMRLIVLSVTGLIMVGLARGRNPFDEDDTDLPLEEQVMKLPDYLTDLFTSGSGYVKLANEMFGQHIPVGRDVIAAAEQSYKGFKDVDVRAPLYSALKDASITAATLARMVTAVADGVALTDVLMDIPAKNQKAIASTTSVFVGGLPVNATFKFMRWMEEWEASGKLMNVVPDDVKKQATEVLKYFIDKYGRPKEDDIEKEFQKMLEMIRNRTQLDEAIIQAQEIYSLMAPVGDEDPLPEIGYDIIAQAESSGEWNARPTRDGKSLSSAFGLFQFTKGTWRNIMESAPELDLTEKGRLDEDTSQQRKAMKWLTKDNARILKRFGVPANLENLYGAHHFGARRWADIYFAKNSAYTKKVLGERAIKANPWLAKKKYEKVKGLKEYIRNRLEVSYDALQKRTPVDRNDEYFIDSDLSLN